MKYMIYGMTSLLSFVAIMNFLLPKEKIVLGEDIKSNFSNYMLYMINTAGTE